jgi:hypothetical protein
MDADCRFPLLGRDDNPEVDFRGVLIERAGLGVEKLSNEHLASIAERGYDAFFVGRMNSKAKIGGKVFRELAAIGRLELTTEYIVFHHFRESLNANSRRQIATLLLDTVQQKN